MEYEFVCSEERLNMEDWNLYHNGQVQEGITVLSSLPVICPSAHLPTVVTSIVGSVDLITTPASS